MIMEISQRTATNDCITIEGKSVEDMIIICLRYNS